MSYQQDLMKRLSPALFCLLCTLSVRAQDALFSQFFAVPMTLNPALSGTYDGKYRISGVYRDQWRSVVEEPFKTYALGLDLRFDSDSRRISKDFFAAGIYFQSDKAGILEYSLNQMYLVGAFHKSLNRSGTQYLGGGVQLGMNQRNINYSRITFQDQFNGIDGYDQATQELFPENNFAHFDLSAGINYILAPKKSAALYMGLSAHHLLGPENSLFTRDPRPEVSTHGVPYRLPVRLSGHIASNIPVNEFLHIQPRAMLSTQGSTFATNLGVTFKLYFLNLDMQNVYLGAFVRMAKGQSNWSSDVMGALIGYGYDNLLIGMSYDFSLNSISSYGRSRGSFELSISYFGVYENEDMLCPSF